MERKIMYKIWENRILSDGMEYQLSESRLHRDGIQ